MSISSMPALGSYAHADVA